MIKHGLQIFACNASRDLAGDIAQTLIVYTAEPGSASQAALERLARGIGARANT